MPFCPAIHLLDQHAVHARPVLPVAPRTPLRHHRDQVQRRLHRVTRVERVPLRDFGIELLEHLGWVELAENPHPPRKRIAVEGDDPVRGKNRTRKRRRHLRRPERIEVAPHVPIREVTVPRRPPERPRRTRPPHTVGARRVGPHVLLDGIATSSRRLRGARPRLLGARRRMRQRYEGQERGARRDTRTMEKHTDSGHQHKTEERTLRVDGRMSSNVTNAKDRTTGATNAPGTRTSRRSSSRSLSCTHHRAVATTNPRVRRE